MQLTNQQQKIVNDAEGHFLVRACPGSGKTFTMAYKAFEDMKLWQYLREGIGLLSFTNTAHQELSEEIRKISGQSINYPHFVGTIDSFINKYIFFPYISELGFDSAKIEMIGEPYTRFYGWSRAQKCSLNLSYELNGDLFYQASSTDIYDEATIEKAKKIKFATINSGHKFTQADANYYALKILQAKPHIAETISERFPYLYVDEAQDTTLIHWEILKLLSACKSNKRFGVIGDPDQSIYGWNGARPELFITHQEELEAKGQVYFLTDCRRSSQKICDFYFLFSSLSSAPNSSDKEIANTDILPKVVFYGGASEILLRIDDFKASLDDGEDCLIISRSMSIIGSATRLSSGNPLAIDKNPFKNDNREALEILHAKSDFDGGNYRASIYRAESAYLNRHKIYNREDHLTQQQLSKREWLTMVEDEIATLPSTALSLKEWCEIASDQDGRVTVLEGIDFIPKKRGSIKYEDIRASDFFLRHKAEDAKKEVDTVHSVKGKTTDHVLLVMNSEQTERMIKVLNGQKIGNSEEKRIFYVAITRARKSITFCVPKDYEVEIKKINNFLHTD